MANQPDLSDLADQLQNVVDQLRAAAGPQDGGDGVPKDSDGKADPSTLLRIAATGRK